MRAMARPLRECPFCGGEAVTQQSRVGVGTTQRGGYVFFVRCRLAKSARVTP